MPADLFRPGSTWLHRLPAQVKLVAALLTVLLVVATPTRQWWAFVAYGVVVVAARRSAQIPPMVFLRRLAVEAPFVAFALLVPFIAAGPRLDLGPVALSEPGLWAAFGILAKATIGVGISVILTATTSVPDIIRGLERLRVPRVITAIMSFMVRYIEVIVGEMDRARVARAARGSDPRWLWQAGAIARGAGTLFVRSYERGERVHLAMRARGFDGSMVSIDHALDAPAASRSHWSVGLAGPVVVAAVASVAWATL